jgi:tetratricopeptide (TPR) repeat protein
MTRNSLSPALALLACALISTPAAAQAGRQRTPAQQAAREAMWPAPTAEDWKKPCLITFQRTFEDALEIAKETKQAILICVNMDGEIASEHYAGIRYRMPEIAALYEPYICVVASVYRHSARDYDEEGNRVLCPRFGSVTCGEHIAIEPGLFDKYFEGERVAPRHLMIELDRTETYDVYYAFDTASVFRKIEEGITQREIQPTIIARGDRPLMERVTSRHIEDQVAVEKAYVTGDKNTRRAILRAAGGQQTELLRLAIFGFDLELAEMARKALAQSSSVAAVDLINEALRVPMEAEERDALIAALERIGGESPRAKTLAVVHRGLARRSEDVDLEGWSRALEEADLQVEPEEWSSIEAQLAYKTEASRSRADDADVQLDLAEASLAMAVDPGTARILSADPKTMSKYQRLMFEDVRRAALSSEELGATGWRVDAVVGLASYYLGDFRTAHARAEQAVDALPPGDESWNGMAVLALFAEGRRRAIWKALYAKEEWPAEWLTDVHAAYSVIARHPHGTDDQVVAHYDFLQLMGAPGQAATVLDAGLERFPESWGLHGRLRARILKEKGVDGLEPAYEAMLAAPGASPNLEWFAGYTSLVTAEFHRRASTVDQAYAAYERAISHYEQGIAANPESRASADHYIALAIAGRARIAFERGDDEAAVEYVLASFDRNPNAAATLDGLGHSAVTTAQLLQQRLARRDRPALAQTVQTALDELPPEMLEPPEFERTSRGRGPVGFEEGGGGRRRGGRGRSGG